MVLCGYEAFHSILVKSADYSSNRSVQSMPTQMIDTAEKTPGKCDA